MGFLIDVSEKWGEMGLGYLFFAASLHPQSPWLGSCGRGYTAVWVRTPRYHIAWHAACLLFSSFLFFFFFSLKKEVQACCCTILVLRSIMFDGEKRLSFFLPPAKPAAPHMVFFCFVWSCFVLFYSRQVKKKKTRPTNPPRPPLHLAPPLARLHRTPCSASKETRGHWPKF